MKLFHEISEQCSRATTELYSTSFASSIKLLHSDMHAPIHNIYGFVRFADEIVDTFHNFDKAVLLDEFKRETWLAIERKISLNPILNSFQQTVNKYKIEHNLIAAFFESMELDLCNKKYDAKGYEKYIYGSAEVVGLMCLSVFCEGDEENYMVLKPFARALGAAFQKVNFLRDIKDDSENLNRMYFPDCDFKNFSYNQKIAVEEDIQKDFDYAYKGILLLPAKAKLGVYVAYKYYLSLFKKIKKAEPQKILQQRIRVPDYGKILILAKANVRNMLNIL